MFSLLPFVLDVVFSRSALTLDYTTNKVPPNQHRMFDKMRWYMIAFSVLLTYSVLHFALAVPVAVGETREVHSNPAEALNTIRDGTAAWEKRKDPNQPKDRIDNAPGNVEEQSDAKGVKGRVLVWPGEWEPEIYYYNPPPKVNMPPKVETVGGNGNGNGNGGGGHSTQSSGSAENVRPGPQSGRPATTSLMTSLKNWLNEPVSGNMPKVFRPRNLDSRANAYVPDSSFLLQTTRVTNILTSISMFRARVTSANSAYDRPVHRQPISDKLD